MAKKTDVSAIGSYEEKKLLATVSGMKIFSDSIYIITGKMDESAPSGYQDLGISKAPFPNNKTVVPCVWDKDLGVYDTGFFTSSPCYNGWTMPERQAEVATRVKNIMSPYEEITGSNLDQSNLDFWDSYSVPCYMGRLFSTNDIKDLFDLYIALQSKALTPKEEDGNPEFADSMFCVEDKTTAVDIKKQRQLDKADLTFKIMNALGGEATEREKVLDLLLYLDVIHSVEINTDMVKYVFMNWIDAKNTNIDTCKDAYNRYIVGANSEEGYEIIKFHRMIKEMAYSGIIGVTANGLLFEGNNLGADFITSAMTLVEDKSLLELKAKIVESYMALKNRQKAILENSGKLK